MKTRGPDRDGPDRQDSEQPLRGGLGRSSATRHLPWWGHFRFRLLVAVLAAAFILLAVFASRIGEPGAPPPPDRGGSVGTDAGIMNPMIIRLRSPVFHDGDPIPRKYTCDGDDVSPPLEWDNLPEGAQSLAIVCEDPDAPVGTWDHWVFYSLPASEMVLPEGVPTDESLDSGAHQGVNDFHRIGYGGPCPPRGQIHRYFFKIYALKIDLQLEPGADKARLMEAMKGNILGEGQLVGTYQR
jgi:Raf kinase inhibitor-like YbhB/YbcL family protein